MTKLSYVFPGQGSQFVGMLEDVAESSSLVGETFSEASEAAGYDIWDLVQTDPDEKLNQTEFTQPALLSASISLWRVARNLGLKQPDVVAGHSLGEYSALVAAGVIDFVDAVRLVQKRGRFMQSAVPLGQGGMAVVLKLDDEQISSICSAISTESGTGSESVAEIVQAANFNAPGQVVIAGHNSALEKASAALKAVGGRVMPLAVSAPFHCELMRPAAEKMQEELAGVTFNQPKISVIQNVNAEYATDPDEIRSNLVEQMYRAVLWTDSVKRLANDGVEILVECGPGKVLSGMIKRISKTLTPLSINSVDSLERAVAELS